MRLDDDPFHEKEVTLEAVIDARVLASLDDEQVSDLFELLCAEVLYRVATTPPGRCGLCLSPTAGSRLCPRHRSLLFKVVLVCSSDERTADPTPEE